MAELSTRAAVAVLQLAAIQLLEAAGVNDIDLTDLNININGRYMRIDIARLTPDGMHVGEWLRGYAIDPRDRANFGTPVTLPGTDGATH